MVEEEELLSSTDLGEPPDQLVENLQPATTWARSAHRLLRSLPPSQTDILPPDSKQISTQSMLFNSQLSSLLPDTIFPFASWRRMVDWVVSRGVNVSSAESSFPAFGCDGNETKMVLPRITSFSCILWYVVFSKASVQNIITRKIYLVFNSIAYNCTEILGKK